jgi:hypothetical protein
VKKLKKLKIWNGRGWGVARYDKNGNHIIDPTGKEYCDHVFVCAHSVVEVVRIVNEVAGYNVINAHEVNVYWHKDCWGNTMNGIEPELGVWTIQHYSDKPKRVYPKEE